VNQERQRDGILYMEMTAEQIQLFHNLDVMLVDDSKVLLEVFSKVLNSLEVGSLRTALEGTPAIRSLGGRLPSGV
jgi:hypothetical protein